MSAAVLYTPDVLGLAVELADFRLTGDLPLKFLARSKSCGSTIELGLDLAPDGSIAKIGVSSHACAIGQASAAIFARAAIGSTADRIRNTGRAIENWLAGNGEMPAWPGLSIIAAAREYPARHGAVMLPWTAAVHLLDER